MFDNASRAKCFTRVHPPFNIFTDNSNRPLRFERPLFEDHFSFSFDFPTPIRSRNVARTRSPDAQFPRRSFREKTRTDLSLEAYYFPNDRPEPLAKRFASIGAVSTTVLVGIRLVALVFDQRVRARSRVLRKLVPAGFIGMGVWVDFFALHYESSTGNGGTLLPAARRKPCYARGRRGISSLTERDDFSNRLPRFSVAFA